VDEPAQEQAGMGVDDPLLPFVECDLPRVFFSRTVLGEE
jgi:hypothetical protein